MPTVIASFLNSIADAFAKASSVGNILMILLIVLASIGAIGLLISILMTLGSSDE